MAAEQRAPDHVAAAHAIVAVSEVGVRITQRIAQIVEDPSLATNAPLGVLVRVFLDAPMRPRDLAAALDLTTGGVTKVIDRLEAAGLVVRSSDPEDARGVLVDLTREGLESTEAILEASGPAMFELASRIERLRTRSRA